MMLSQQQSAATSFFEPVTIDNRQYVDGAFGANNPIEEVEEEAADIWCHTTRQLKPSVKCIISVGTGNPGKKALDDKIHLFLTKTLVRMALKPEGIEGSLTSLRRRGWFTKRGASSSVRPLG
ncbi:hypothetical protein N7481_000099 [Penicillium waksmanii]|uniref:uncharacterized protein n=1 Tax=Penicillium waksmanii TaxID=69791 RepID=UPI0025496307|nr:uncharacterized protein N7481_000099 [Penicillium waksmanii]KAJ5999690.1 hypothetical protein N7481_000099 [Penicillium waksmanii]